MILLRFLDNIFKCHYYFEKKFKLRNFIQICLCCLEPFDSHLMTINKSSIIIPMCIHTIKGSEIKSMKRVHMSTLYVRSFVYRIMSISFMLVLHWPVDLTTHISLRNHTCFICGSRISMVLHGSLNF